MNLSDWRLVRMISKGETRSFPLKLGENKLGRDAECDIRTYSKYSSHQHCTITVTKEDIRLSNMSRVGTFVNKTKVLEGETREICENDLIGIGCDTDFSNHKRFDTTAFVFKIIRNPFMDLTMDSDDTEPFEPEKIKLKLEAMCGDCDSPNPNEFPFSPTNSADSGVCSPSRLSHNFKRNRFMFGTDSEEDMPSKRLSKYQFHNVTTMSSSVKVEIPEDIELNSPRNPPLSQPTISPMSPQIDSPLSQTNKSPVRGPKSPATSPSENSASCSKNNLPKSSASSPRNRPEETDRCLSPELSSLDSMAQQDYAEQLINEVTKWKHTHFLKPSHHGDRTNDFKDMNAYKTFITEQVKNDIWTRIRDGIDRSVYKHDVEFNDIQEELRGNELRTVIMCHAVPNGTFAVHSNDLLLINYGGHKFIFCVQGKITRGHKISYTIESANLFFRLDQYKQNKFASVERLTGIGTEINIYRALKCLENLPISSIIISPSQNKTFTADKERPTRYTRILHYSRQQTVVLSNVVSACRKEAANVSVINGAPGTGKSYLLVEIACRLAADGKKVLVAASDNDSSNQLGWLFQNAISNHRSENERLVEAIVYDEIKRGETPMYHQLNPINDLETRGLQKDSVEFERELTAKCNAADIVITNFSSHGLVGLQRLAPEFDVALIDDAHVGFEWSQIGLFRSNISSLVLFGDIKQIKEIVHGRPGKSLFARFYRDSLYGRYILKDQFRMNLQTSHWLNEMFKYEMVLMRSSHVLEHPIKEYSVLNLKGNSFLHQAVSNILAMIFDKTKDAEGKKREENRLKVLIIVPNQSTKKSLESFLRIQYNETQYEFFIKLPYASRSTKYNIVLLCNPMELKSIGEIIYCFSRAKHHMIICGQLDIKYADELTGVWESFTKNAKERLCFHEVNTNVIEPKFLFTKITK